MEETSAVLAMKTLWIIPFLKLCCAQQLLCNVTQDSHGTLYSVPKSEATNCPYSWMNSTGHVLANERGKVDDLVFNSSIGTFLTRKCFSQLNYTRDCVSEKIQQSFYCFTDCIIQEPVIEVLKGIPRLYWGTVATVSFFMLVLLVLFLSCIQRRNQEKVKAQHISKALEMDLSAL